MIPGTPALDPDYERCIDPGEWQVIYDTNARCYRREKVSRLLWGKVTPVDPDAALTPERFPREMSKASMDALRQSSKTASAETERVILSCLRQYGPQPRLEIASRTGLVPDTVSDALKRRPDLFAHDGRYHNRKWRALTHDSRPGA